MVKTLTTRKYELVIIIDAKFSKEEKENIVKDATEGIKKGGGKVINNQIWMEKQKLAFSLKRCLEGTYYLINFEADGAKIDKIKSLLKLNEKILRFSIIK